MKTEFAGNPRPDSGWSHLEIKIIQILILRKLFALLTYLCAGWRTPKLLARSALRSAIKGRGKEDKMAEPRTLSMVVVVIVIVKTMEMTKMGALDMMTVKMTMANMMMTVGPT